MMSTRRYTIFHPLLLSFYSPSLYRDVAKHWRGIAALYLLLLLAMTWIPNMLRYHRDLQEVIALKSPKIIRQLPGFQLEDGKLSVNRAMPYIIKDPINNLPMIIIDTTGNIQSLINNQATILITEHKVLIRKSLDNVMEFSFPSWLPLNLDKASLHKILRRIGLGFSMGAYVVLLILSFTYRIIQSLLYGALCLLFATIASVKLRYPQAISLAIIAVTPAVMVATLMDWAGWHFAGQSAVYFVLTIGYLLFAVSVQRMGSGSRGQAAG